MPAHFYVYIPYSGLVFWCYLQANLLDMLVAACEVVDASSSEPAQPDLRTPPDLGRGRLHS